MVNLLMQINEISQQLPPLDISDTIKKNISLLVSVHHKVVERVTLIAKDLNCKKDVNTFYTNQNAETNQVIRINNISQPVSPVKRKSSTIEVL